jgi:N-terminal half of MaoC dehydratase
LTASDEEQNQAGTTYSMVVERGKIREFARATKSSNPEYLHDENPVSPTTFLVTSSFWQDAPVRRSGGGGAGGSGSGSAGGGGAGYERMLHGAQEFVFFGAPPRAGTKLTVHSRPGPEYEKTGRRGGVMKFRELITEYRDEKGELVAEAHGTIIETSQAPTGSANT